MNFLDPAVAITFGECIATVGNRTSGIEVAEQRAEGAELNRLVKQAKKQPMSFAFCPGPTDENDVLYIHRQKSPEILAKIARDESAGTKTAFGTLAVTGKTLSLTCLRELPALAKQLRRYMKSQGQPMEIRVLRPGEAELTAQTEALIERLRAVQSDVKATPGKQGDKLRSAMQGAVALINSGDLTKAQAAIKVVEAALTRADNTPKSELPDEAAVYGRIAKSQALVEAFDTKKRAALAKGLASAETFLKAGDLSKATLVVDAVEKAIANKGESE